MKLSAIGSAIARKLNIVETMSVVAKSLKYSKFGEPLEVLELVEDTLPAPKDKQVLVKILAAPINPSDVLTIKGTYPAGVKFPSVPGNEFVGEVISVGENVKTLQPGVRVLPRGGGLGTWRTHAVLNEDQLAAFPKEIGLLEAATIIVNPCTAYRMLKDFVKLSPGDTVIQNGANSAAGQAVHQLCRAWGINSVGIVRDRPEINKLKQELKDLGATEVLTEEELTTTDIFDSGKLKRPALAFNCVGGKSATELTRHLDAGGILVVYGAMTYDPVSIAAAPMIFKDISLRGFWLTATNKKLSAAEYGVMIKDICELIGQGKFVGPAHELVPLSQFKEAAAALTMKGFTGKKLLFDTTK